MPGRLSSAPPQGRQHCTRPVIPRINAYAELVPNAIGLTAIVTVGDEILSGHTQDTNSSLLARARVRSGPPGRPHRGGGRPAGRDHRGDPARDRRPRRSRASPSAAGSVRPPTTAPFRPSATRWACPLELNPIAYANIEAMARRMHAAGLDRQARGLRGEPALRHGPGGRDRAHQPARHGATAGDRHRRRPMVVRAPRHPAGVRHDRRGGADPRILRRRDGAGRARGALPIGARVRDVRADARARRRNSPT